MVAIAAAAFGRLVSLPRALVGGLGLGIFIAFFDTFLPRWSDDYTWLQPIQENLTPAMPFVVLFGVLVLWPAIRRDARGDRPAGGCRPAASVAGRRRPQRRADPRHADLRRSCSSRSPGYVVFTEADQSWLFLVTQAVILSTIFLSITVITGFAGQISLCQGTFAAIGGFTVFQLADRHGMSVLLAPLIGRVDRGGRRCGPVAARAAASAGSGWRSPRWPSPSSSTR